MALLSNNSHIVPTVMIDLRLDGGIRKNFAVEVRDIIHVLFNKNGLATAIEGKVISINASTTAYGYTASGVANYDTLNCCNINGPYMIIDGSGTFTGRKETVYLGSILDCDMISKWSDNYVITTPPADSTAGVLSIDMLRIHEDKLEYSINNGESWNPIGVLWNNVGADNLDSAINALRVELKAYVDSKI